MESCGGPITAVGMEDAMADCGGNTVPRLEGLSYELYSSMSGLFGNLLASVFVNWQQNRVHF